MHNSHCLRSSVQICTGNCLINSGANCLLVAAKFDSGFSSKVCCPTVRQTCVLSLLIKKTIASYIYRDVHNPPPLLNSCFGIHGLLIFYGISHQKSNIHECSRQICVSEWLECCQWSPDMAVLDAPTYNTVHPLLHITICPHKDSLKSE